jgi:hypothetical protein
VSVENRKHPRYAIELDAKIRVGHALITGRTHDISRGGFCMLARDPVPVHAAAEVRLALVFSETVFSEQLTLAAETVWCTRIKDLYQIGVKFGALDGQSHGYLELFMKFLGGDEPENDGVEP